MDSKSLDFIALVWHHLATNRFYVLGIFWESPALFTGLLLFGEPPLQRRGIGCAAVTTSPVLMHEWDAPVVIGAGSLPPRFFRSCSCSI